MARKPNNSKAYAAVLKRAGMTPTTIMAPLAGVAELRDAVAWADGQPEYTHDWQTPEQILARYRKAQAEG